MQNALFNDGCTWAGLKTLIFFSATKIIHFRLATRLGHAINYDGKLPATVYMYLYTCTDTVNVYT